jgi:hypothetical protein
LTKSESRTTAATVRSSVQWLCRPTTLRSRANNCDIKQQASPGSLYALPPPGYALHGPKGHLLGSPHRRINGTSCCAVALIGAKTSGFILSNQLRTLDLAARKARRIERAPAAVIEDTPAKVRTLVE